MRIVIGNKKLHSKKYAVFNTDAKTIFLDTAHLKNDKPLAEQICEKLFERQIISLMVEGGPKTIQQFIDENIWDEARVFEGNAEIENGIRAPKFSTRSSKALKIGKDRLWTVTNKLF